MILLASSKTRDGLVNVRDLREVTTACTGSWKKCFAAVDVSESLLRSGIEVYIPDMLLMGYCPVGCQMERCKDLSLVCFPVLLSTHGVAVPVPDHPSGEGLEGLSRRHIEEQWKWRWGLGRAEQPS